MYSASLGDVPGSGALASTAPTVTTQHKNSAANAGGDTKALHLAIGVIVFALLVLLIGRGYLRNARVL